jgi:predicted PurR-regulated permease PerM
MPTETKYLRNIALILGAFFVIIFLYITSLMQGFLIPIFLAFFTALILQPFIERLHKTHVPNWLSTLIVVVIFVVVISVFITILSASFTSFVVDFTRRGGRVLYEMPGHNYPVKSAQFSPDGKFAVSTSEDNTIKLWNIKSGEEEMTLYGHELPATTISISSDSRYILSGSEDASIILWNRETGNSIRTLSGHSAAVRSVVFFNDGKQAISGGDDGLVLLWDIATGSIAKRFVGHSAAVKSVSISPDQKYIISGSSDSSIRIWDIEYEMEILTFNEHTGPVIKVRFSQDGKSIVSLDSEDLFKWDATSGAIQTRFKKEEYRILDFELLNRENQVITVNSNNSITVWYYSNGYAVRNFFGSEYQMTGISVNPREEKAVTSTSGTFVILWDITSGLAENFQNRIIQLARYIATNEFLRQNINMDQVNTMVIDLASAFVSVENFKTFIVAPIGKTFDILRSFGLYVIALVFILPGMGRINESIQRAFPNENGPKINKIISNIKSQIQNYMIAKTIISFGVAVISYFILLLFQIKYALLWAFIIFLFNYIPYIGSIIAVMFPMMMSIIIYQSFLHFSGLTASLIGAQVFMGNIVEPKFMSKGVNLSPIVIFTSLMVWGYVWGIVGVFIAVPMMSAFNLICENIEPLNFISTLISARQKEKKKRKFRLPRKTESKAPPKE